jgi:hypothetical protein
VFGILNLLFGGLGLCGIVMTAAFMFVPLNPQMAKDNPALQLMEENAVYLARLPRSPWCWGFFATIA